MDLDEIAEARLQRLKDLIKRFDGNVSETGRRLGYKDGAFVRQFLARTRPITEKTVAKWRTLPAIGAWFDVPQPDFVLRNSDGTVTVIEVKTTKPAASPPPPPGGFADRLEVSLSDWALLQDVKNAATQDELATIRARARRLDAEFEKMVERRLVEARVASGVHARDASKPVDIDLGGISQLGDFQDAPEVPQQKGSK